MRAKEDSDYSYNDTIIAPRGRSLLQKRPPIAVESKTNNLDDDYKITFNEINTIGDGVQEQMQKEKLRRMSVTFRRTSIIQADDGFEKEVNDNTTGAKVNIILKQAIPAIFCAIANMVQENVNLIFIGHLNNAEMMAGVGMGNMLMNIFGLTIAMGLNGALETLSSQAFGSSNLELCSVYLNRGRVILISAYIPILIILLQAERILIALGQDPLVADYTLQYIKAYLPGMMLMGLIDGQRRFLNMMNQTRTPMLAYYISIVFHIVLSWLFVWKMNLGIVGTGIASTLTNSINYIFLLVLSRCIPEISGAIKLPDARAFSGLCQYLKLGIPSTIMLCLEFWVYDIMILMSGYIGVKEQACQIVVINLVAVIWMVSVGLQQAASSSIGQQIGKGDVKKAKEYYDVLNRIAVILFLAVLILVYIYKVNLIMLFTGNVDIITLSNTVFGTALIGTFPDLMLGYQQGVIRALGIQGNVLYITIIGYWFIQMPLAYYLGFVVELGHNGMWISMVIAQWFIAICFQIMITRADWNKSCEASKARQLAELSAIQKASKKMKKDDQENLVQ